MNNGLPLDDNTVIDCQKPLEVKLPYRNRLVDLLASIPQLSIHHTCDR